MQHHRKVWALPRACSRSRPIYDLRADQRDLCILHALATATNRHASEMGMPAHLTGAVRNEFDAGVVLVGVDAAEPALVEEHGLRRKTYERELLSLAAGRGQSPPPAPRAYWPTQTPS